jgi:inorganic pyrophosphatase
MFNEINEINKVTEVNVYIEISKDSNIKYEYNKELKSLVCDRILYTPFKYEFNYGFIPNTLSDDGDELDAIVLINEALIPGSYIKCKIVGCLETSDEKGNDPKLILVPINKIDPNSKNINDINDISEHVLKKIKYFYEHYKDLEDKKVIVKDFLNKDKSTNLYINSIINNNL